MPRVKRKLPSPGPLPLQHYSSASMGVGNAGKTASSRTCLSKGTFFQGDKTWNANSGWHYTALVWIWIVGSQGNWTTIFDFEIVMAFVWASLHERPTCWACRRNNWPDGLWPREKLPSQPTMSRRLGTTEVQRLLHVMEEHLVQLRQTDWVKVVDGKPLLVGSHSKDPDAAWGRAGRSYAKGYKLHAVYGSSPLPLSWEVAPLNRSEPEVAARLIPALHGGGYLLGDKAYDSNPLHDLALRTGHQLVAERKRPQAGLGHRQHSPGRLRSMALLENEFGKNLYHCRDDIERQFGWLTNHAGGLSPLPNWVRREHRVRSWIQAKLIIHAIYVYLYHPSANAS